MAKAALFASIFIDSLPHVLVEPTLAFLELRQLVFLQLVPGLLIEIGLLLVPG